MHLYQNRKRIRNRKLWLGIAAFAVVIAIFWLLFTRFTKRTDERELALVEDAIRRAMVTCYAIEGRYPESFTYLSDNYGVVVDEGRYYVRFEAFASNVMPSVTVLRKGGAS